MLPTSVHSTLTATVTADSNVTYTWAFGNNDTGSGGIVSHSYPDVGLYTAMATTCDLISKLAATTTTPITRLLDLAIRQMDYSVV
jgi:hypothetical protein